MSLKNKNTAILGDDGMGHSIEVEVTPGDDFAVLVFKDSSGHAAEGVKETKIAIELKMLFNFCYTIAEDPLVQEKLIPVRKSDIMQFVRQHEIKVQRDMKAGESVFARCVVDIPQTTIDALKGLVKPVDPQGWENRRMSGIDPEEMPDGSVPSPVHIDRA